MPRLHCTDKRARHALAICFCSSHHVNIQIRSLLHKAVQRRRQERDHETAVALPNGGALRLRRSESGDSFVAQEDENDDIGGGPGRAPTISIGRTLPAGSSLTRAQSEKRAMSLARAVQSTDYEQLASGASQPRPSRGESQANRSASKARSAMQSTNGEGNSSEKRSGSRPMGFGLNVAKRPGASVYSLGNQREDSVLARMNRTSKHASELELPKWSRSEVRVLFSQARPETI